MGQADEGNRRAEGASALTLHCRGLVRLYCGESDCTPKSKKGRALLAILAAEQRPLTRVRIADLLWSNRQEEQARASLRTLLADLKEQFQSRFDQLLVVDREHIALGPTVGTDLKEPTIARPSGELFEGLDHIDPELDEWLRTERGRWAEEAPARTSALAAASTSHPLPRWELTAILLAVIATVALLIWRPWSASPQPVVAVLKFKDLTGRNALLADGLAEELRLGLAQNPGIDVIGRTSSEHPSIGSSEAGQRLGATHVIEGSLRPLGRELQLNVRAIDGRSGRALWSGAAKARGAGVAIGTTNVGAQIAELLTDALSRRVPPYTLKADDRAYEAVFAARASISAGSSHEAARHRAALQEIVRAHPNFVPALVALSRATMSASDHPFMRGPIPLRRARGEAAFYARRAIRLAPSYAPGYEALANAYRDMKEALPLLRKTVALSPGMAVAHRRLAWELEQDGDYAGALERWRTAARLDPLNLASHIQLLRALDFSGDKQELRNIGAAFAARLSDPKNRWTFDAIRASYEGNWSRFLVSAIKAERLDPEDLYTQRILFPLGLVFGKAAARPYAGDATALTAMVFNRNTRGIIRKMNEAPADFFRLNFETARVGEYLASVGRLDAFIMAYDAARASKDPPTYTEVGLVGDLLVLGLREQGRSKEAEHLLAIMEEETRRVRGVRPEHMNVFMAPWDMLRGRSYQAAARLERAYREEWALGLLNDGEPAWSRHVFAAISNDPRIVQIRKRYEREIAREREEAIREMMAAKLRPLRCRAIPRICPN